MRSDFRVSGLKVIGHDLHGPAVAPKPVNNCADATKPLVQVGRIVPEASAGQVVFLEFDFRQGEQGDNDVNVQGILSFQRGT
jgi:hypothetical protein